MSLTELVAPLFQYWPFFLLALYFAVKLRLKSNDKGRKPAKDDATQIEAIKKRESELSRRESGLSKLEASLKDREASIAKQEASLNKRELHLNTLVRDKTISLVRDIASREYIVQSPTFQFLQSSSPATLERLRSALSSSMKISSPFDIHATIVSDSGHSYRTTLYKCSCPDFQHRNAPCKHMLRLAIEVGLLLSIDFVSIQNSLSDALSQKKSTMQNLDALLSKKQRLISEISELQSQHDLLLNDKSQAFPMLSKLIAEYESLQDKKREDLIHGPHVSSAKEERARLSREKKELRYANKLLEHQLLTYESLFPWLEEFKEITPAEASIAAGCVVSDDSESEYTSLKNYVSADEWIRLSDANKYQLILDRWKRRKRSDWEAGIEYERFVGYRYESDGYRVTYSGATLGKQDMGRDIIAERENEILVIQCKRYAENKHLVHENTVFQLYGSCIVYSLGLPNNRKVRPIIITSAALSDVALECAKRLFVEVIDHFPLVEYPIVKCNISKDGSKIYHLPFDQQYDRVVISPDNGEFYAATVSEAEAAGFRRAWRWSGSKAN